MITNVRVLGGSDDDFEVTCNFVTYRSKDGHTETYLGHHRYRLTVDSDDIRVRHKTTFLDVDNINDQGKVSIIV